MFHHEMSRARKAQEEMVGFVLIMVVVAVIFLVFLGIYINQKPKDAPESRELSQFMDAMLEVSTPCGSGYDVWDVADLITKCATDESATCLPTTTDKACDKAQEVIIEMTELTWEFSEESPRTGYKYAFTKESADNIYEVPIFINTYYTNQSGSYKRTLGSQKVLPGGVRIYLEIRTK